ncbi:hypothetical protein PV325_007596 [Microctonus aethiopoides]|nr:hypothetical protein PV325_007596 [Microctonus aethiopoides]
MKIKVDEGNNINNENQRDNDDGESCRISSNETSDSSYHPDTDESSDHDIIKSRNSTASMKENNNDSCTMENSTTLEASISFKYKQTKLYRHLQRKHRNVKEVKDLLALNINTGELKVMRRPNNTKFNKNASDFVLCPQCKGNYSKSALRYHYQRCSKKNLHSPRTRFFYNARYNIAKAIRYDELAVEFEHNLCSKERDPHYYDMIRQKMRQIGRLFLELGTENDGIDHLFSGEKEQRDFAKDDSIGLTKDYSSSVARTAIETQFKNKR